MNIFDSFEAIGSGLIYELGGLRVPEIGTAVENLKIGIGEALQDTVVPEIGQVAVTETSPPVAIETAPSNVVAFKPKQPTVVITEQNTDEQTVRKAMEDDARRRIEAA